MVGSKRHAGADHLVVRQPDRTLALLPAWMTEPAAAACRLVARPQLSLARWLMCAPSSTRSWPHPGSPRPADGSRA